MTIKLDKTEREFRDALTEMLRKSWGDKFVLHEVLEREAADAAIDALDLEFREEEGEGMPETELAPCPGDIFTHCGVEYVVMPMRGWEVIPRKLFSRQQEAAITRGDAANRLPKLEALAREAMEWLDWWQSTFDNRAEPGNERAGLRVTSALVNNLRELLGEEG